MLNIALYQPDIPQNLGATMRLSACMNVGLDIIEPCGFIFDDRKIKKSGMDYVEHSTVTRHKSWTQFQDTYKKRRVILLTTKASVPYTDFKFQSDDILMAGRESAGVPDDVHEAVQGRILIPMQTGMRSLNIVNSISMVLGEALRQTQGFSPS